MESLIWEKNTAILKWERKLNGSNKFGERKLDFDYFGISRNGLLEIALSEMKYPQRPNIINCVLQMLEYTKTNGTILQILSTRTSDLSPNDIIKLYTIIETTIENRGSISNGSRNDSSWKFRAIFLKCSNKLKNGEMVKEVRFRSKFPSPNSSTGKMDAANKKASKSLLNEDSLKSIDHNDAESLRENFHKRALTDLKAIQDVCTKAIDTYKSVKDQHLQLLERYRDQPPPKTILWSKDPMRAMGQKLAELERRGCYTFDGFKNIMAQNPKYVANTALGLDHGMKFIHNPFNPLWQNQITRKEYYFCAFFMPRVVIEAAQCLFTIHTAWNVGPVASLTPAHIHHKKGFYIVYGVKSKTNTTENIKVFKKNHPDIYDLITLILEHNKNVDRYWSRKDENLWATWSDVDYGFRMMSDGMEKKYIAKPAGLPLFSKKQLRDQVVTIQYLEDPDPFKIKEKLGHMNIATTLVYLNQLVLRLMHQSHVKRFMDRLGATIMWAVGGKQEVERCGMSLERIDDRLLFPVANRTGNISICDLWLESMGTMKVKIGRPEIEHLRYQIDFYSRYHLTLKQNNPKRFLIYDIPRILFCTAMAELVRNSPYANLLN